jgi:uncharacterized membrane protein AbrB (regulator of aidB expression)
VILRTTSDLFRWSVLLTATPFVMAMQIARFMIVLLLPAARVVAQWTGS